MLGQCSGGGTTEAKPRAGVRNPALGQWYSGGMSGRKTILPDARRLPRFAGVSTFCRFPLLSEVADENRPVDWAIYGVPFDGGVSYRPGARFGPRAVRDASQYVKPYHLTHRIMLTEALSIADAGDAPVQPYSCEKTQESAAAFAESLGEPGHTKTLAIGGDHSIALANMRAAWKRGGEPRGGLALLHFDSHIDTLDSLWDERHSHASVLIRAFEEGLVDPQRTLSVGVSGPLNRPDDLDYAIDRGVRIVTYDDWRREGFVRIENFVSEIAAEPAYLSFDIDVIDPAYAPGTGTPSVGGFTSAEALETLRSLAGVNLMGADVVEALPDRDVAGITALLAGHVIFEILCLDAIANNSG